MTTTKKNATTRTTTKRAGATTKRTPEKNAPTAKHSALGMFEVTDADDQTHKCVGNCGAILPIRKFPTTKASGVRVAECRACRDARTTKAADGKASK